MFKLSFNCNKQVLKINFKQLFKWTFVQNQSCKVLKIKQFLCSNIFKLLCKKWRKAWISKCIGHFQMHTSFKFYLSNKASNEFVPETKVVAFEVLNNFCTQKFFVWPQEQGEKLNLQTELWNFELITSLPLLYLSLLCFLSRRTPALPLAGHAPSSGQNRHRAPLSGTAQACHAPPAPLRTTRRRTSSSRHRRSRRHATALVTA